MKDLIDEFLAQKIFAVAGSFRNEEKVAYKILKDLKARGYIVYPVNPQSKEVDGQKCYPSVMDIPGPVDVLDLVTPSSATEQIVKQCRAKGITRVWIQPGAESETAIKYCNDNNIKVVYNACVMRDGSKDADTK